MGIDVTDIGGVQSAGAQGHFHATRRAFAPGRRGGEMVGVRRVAVADNLAINFRAAGLGVLQFLQHQEARAFAHHETVAFQVKRARGAFRLGVAGAHGAHRAKSADAHRHNRGLRAAGENRDGIPHFDGAPGFADGVGGRGAGGTGGKIRAAQFVIHREQAGGDVRDEHGNHERRDALGAAFEQDGVLLLGGVQAADAGADEHADFIAVRLGQIKAGIQQGLVAGENAKLREAVGALEFLGRGKRGGGIEVLDLGGNLAIEAGGVEGADPVNAALAGRDLAPERVHLLPEGGNHPEAGDDNPAFGPINCHKISGAA
jgi:hypothetical protein